MKAKGRVFISYRREGGAELARLIRDSLVKRGYKVFLDIEELRGGLFNKALFNEIESSTDVVVILTPNSIDRCLVEGDWVSQEVAHAIREGKNIVPVMTHDFKWPTSTLPDELVDLPKYNGVLYSHEHFDASMDKLGKLLTADYQKTWPKKILLAGIVAVCASIALLLLSPYFSRTSIEKKAAVHLAYLNEGNTYFRNGNLKAAQEEYRKILQSAPATGQQRAAALMGLGRIASVQKQNSSALTYYRQAADAAPENEKAFLAQALLLEGNDNSKEALHQLEKAQLLAPNDRIIKALINDIRDKVSLAQDQARQTRIDSLVNDLLQRLNDPPRALPNDGWTSLPLTLWIKDFTVTGYSLQEGGDRLLAAGLTDQIVQHGRVQLVARTLLDKVLDELKIGSSNLTDQSTALSLGKLLAVRLIVSGQIIHSGPQTQVSMRLIETETGRISGSISKTAPQDASLSDLAASISENLIQKLKKLYPLRGEITATDSETVLLNIGHRIGVESGQRFNVVNEDTKLEVFSTEDDTSMAKIIQGSRNIVSGQRIHEEIL